MHSCQNLRYDGKQHYRRSPIPEAINPSCNKNITFSEPNPYYPHSPGAIWMNCCDGSDPTHCQPIETFESDCPVGYSSCADSYQHPEMCSIKEFDSQDGSGVFGYANRLSRTQQQKCCPTQFSCGGSFDAPCIYIGGNPDPEEPAILTNPMYLERISVYPGCDEKAISPSAVGVIVAVVIIGFCVIGGFLLWLVKKRLHRNPNKSGRVRRKSLAASAAHAKAADIECGSDLGTVSTRDENCAGAPGGEDNGSNPRGGRRGIIHGRSKSKSVSPKQDYELESTKSSIFAKRDGEFNAVLLDPQLTSRVLDFAGITVTHEIQIVREHGSGNMPSQAESLRGDEYSISSRSATSERCYEPAPLVRPPVNAVVRPVSSASQNPQTSSRPGFRRSLVGPSF